MTTDELLKQIIAAVDLNEDWSTAIRSLPVFQPQEKKAWPDGVGVWDLDGELWRSKYSSGMILVSPLNSNRWYSRGDSEGPQGGWLEVITITPSVKEPEPLPEKPPRLYAKCYCGCGEWDWHVRNEKFWSRPGIHNHASSVVLNEINEAASDPEAVELWKKETEGKS